MHHFQGAAKKRHSSTNPSYFDFEHTVGATATVDAALEHLQAMNRKGIHPTLTSYNSLLRRLQESQDVRFFDVYRQLKSNSVSADRATFQLALQAAKQAEPETQPKLLREVIDDMRQAGFIPRLPDPAKEPKECMVQVQVIHVDAEDPEQLEDLLDMLPDFGNAIAHRLEQRNREADSRGNATKSVGGEEDTAISP
eukprot:EG_transcript_30718